MTIQSTAALLSFVGIAAMVGVYLYVLSRSSEEVPYEAVQPRAYAVRKSFFFVLLVGFFLVPALTLRNLPYSPQGGDPTIVDVTAHQWYWEMSRMEFQVGEPIIFRVGSADVNHGFAVYDPTNRIIAQVQAMPGYVNGLALQFDHPGTYKIMCLEYCGLVHHGMVAALTVSDGQGSL